MKTRIEHIGTGLPTSLTVYFDIDEPSQFYPYGYLHRDHIYVYDENQNPVPFFWDTPTGNTITVNAPVGFVFYIQRTVPRDELYVEWEDGAVLHDRNLAAAHLQHLMIIQEIDDGFIFGIEDPDNSLLPVIFRGIHVPDEVDPIRIGAILTPNVANRAGTVFVWDALGDIVGVPLEDFLGFIGESSARPGQGMVGEAVDELTYFNVGAGRGIAVDADTVRFSNPLATGVNGEDEAHFLIGSTWERADATNVAYDSDNTVIPDEYNTVQGAMAILAVSVLALTAGVRFRDGWDALTDTPNLNAASKRTGDYWRVTVEGDGLGNYTDIDGNPITLMKVGESMVWYDYDNDGTPVQGWRLFPVAQRLPADNIDVNNNSVTDLEPTSQLAHEERAREIDNLQAISLVAGMGLVGTGTLIDPIITFDIGEGVGIIVGDDIISVDLTVVAEVGHTHTLVELTDTTITTPAINDVLTWDGGKWINQPVPDGGGGGVPTDRQVTAGAGLTGGGTLAQDITINAVGGAGITVNTDDIEVDFGTGSSQAARGDHTHTYGNPNTSGSNGNGNWWKCGDTGRIEQWGSFPAVQGDKTLTFPIPFTTTPSVILQDVIPRDDGTEWTSALKSAPSVTSVLITGTGDASTVYWRATGY